MCNTGRKAISDSGEVFSALDRFCLGRPRLRLGLNSTPSQEIANFLPLLHNVLFSSFSTRLLGVLRVVYKHSAVRSGALRITSLRSISSRVGRASRGMYYEFAGHYVMRSIWICCIAGFFICLGKIERESWRKVY